MSLRALRVATLVVGALVLAAPVVAQNIFPSDCLPPANSTYVGPFHARYSDGTNSYELSEPQFSGFTSCTPPPGPGGSSQHTFGSEMLVQVFVNGGSPQGYLIRGDCTCREGPYGLSKLLSGQTQFFETEMLQLDLSGGGILLRESPTQASTGTTSIADLGGGTYRIDSFFDVFTDLSVDGGQTWHPSTDADGNPYAGRLMIPGSVAVNSSPWGQVKSLFRTP